MKMPITVIYLSTLALDNLSNPTPFDQWLAVYQSLNKGQKLMDLKHSDHAIRSVSLRNTFCQVI